MVNIVVSWKRREERIFLSKEYARAVIEREGFWNKSHFFRIFRGTNSLGEVAEECFPRARITREPGEAT